jgi:hypothetical protein
VIDLKGGCIAGEEATVSIRPLAGQKGQAKLVIKHLGTGEERAVREVPLDGSGAVVDVPVGALDAAGYSAEMEIVGEAGKGPNTRRDFACERGGEEWADSRPDVARLEAIAAATGGKYVRAADAGSLPLPPAMQVAAERQVAPILPPWAWSLFAAVALGAHWVVRRRSGLV